MFSFLLPPSLPPSPPFLPSFLPSFFMYLYILFARSFCIYVFIYGCFSVFFCIVSFIVRIYFFMFFVFPCLFLPLLCFFQNMEEGPSNDQVRVRQDSGYMNSRLSEEKPRWHLVSTSVALVSNPKMPMKWFPP